MEAMNYVKPELIVVAFVLYFFGVALRQAHIRTYAYLGEMRASTNPLAYCEGGFYGGHAGDSGGGAEQLCESDYQADP